MSSWFIVECIFEPPVRVPLIFIIARQRQTNNVKVIVRRYRVNYRRDWKCDGREVSEPRWSRCRAIAMNGYLCRKLERDSLRINLALWNPLPLSRLNDGKVERDIENWGTCELSGISAKLRRETQSCVRRSCGNLTRVYSLIRTLDGCMSRKYVIGKIDKLDSKILASCTLKYFGRIRQSEKNEWSRDLLSSFVIASKFGFSESYFIDNWPSLVIPSSSCVARYQFELFVSLGISVLKGQRLHQILKQGLY